MTGTLTNSRSFWKSGVITINAGEKTQYQKATGNRKSSGHSFRAGARSRVKYILELYVSGMTLRSTLAVENIRRICEDYIPDCDPKIIDIFQRSAVARDAQIIAVPALKKAPFPAHWLAGDLSQTGKVLAGLNIGCLTGLQPATSARFY